MIWSLAMAQQAGGSSGDMVIAVLSLLFGFALLFVALAASWKIYAKAGQPGWAALIPFYNIVVFLKIVGRPGWWLLLWFVPVVNVVISLMLMHDLSRAFGKGIGFTLGLIFLSPIFMLLLAFGPAQYVGVRIDEPAVVPGATLGRTG